MIEWHSLLYGEMKLQYFYIKLISVRQAHFSKTVAFNLNWWCHFRAKIRSPIVYSPIWATITVTNMQGFLEMILYDRVPRSALFHAGIQTLPTSLHGVARQNRLKKKLPKIYRKAVPRSNAFLRQLKLTVVLSSTAICLGWSAGADQKISRIAFFCCSRIFWGTFQSQACFLWDVVFQIRSLLLFRRRSTRV